MEQQKEQLEKTLDIQARLNKDMVHFEEIMSKEGYDVVMNALRALDGSLYIRATYDDENIPPTEMWKKRFIEHILHSTRDYGPEYENGRVRIQALNIILDIDSIIPAIEEE